MLTKAQVIDRLEQYLRLRGRDFKTVRAYAATARRYYDYALTCPRDWTSEQKAEAYLTHRVLRDHVAAATQNSELAALNALYESRGAKLGNVDALRAKRPIYERHCPSHAEVRDLLATLSDTPELPARFIATWLASMGLRVGEGLEIRLKDIRRHPDGSVRLVLREPKHGHDRVVIVPTVLHDQLRAQADYAKRVFDLDQERATPLPLQIPHALARKYPRSPHTIGWAFLFPSARPMRHPDTGAMVRWHIPDWTVQQAFAAACDTLERAGRIHARITPHCLRHWYGTHFQGDIRDLQAMLGHKSLETTQTYRHPHLDRVRSPILELLSPAA
jgi:integrase